MRRKDLILSLGGEHVVHLFILYSNEQINNNRAPLVDIYQVKQEMGHSSVTTTEIYTLIDLKKLRQHFPTLTSGFTDDEIESQKVSKSSTMDTNMMDTKK